MCGMVLIGVTAACRSPWSRLLSILDARCHGVSRNGYHPLSQRLLIEEVEYAGGCCS